RRQHGAEKIFFTRSVIYQRAQARARQPSRQFAVSLRRPTLRAPPRARIEQSKFADTMLREPSLRAFFNLSVNWKRIGRKRIDWRIAARHKQCLTNRFSD